MQLKRYLNSITVKVLAAILLFLGFGMIHGSNQIVEKAGSVLIGIGSFYFILILIKSLKKE